MFLPFRCGQMWKNRGLHDSVRFVLNPIGRLLDCGAEKTDYSSGRVNHLYFQSSIGSLIINWNDKGQLTSIHWADRSDQRRPWSALTRSEIPPAVSRLLDRLKVYFDSGDPLGVVPWDDIDQTGWSDFQREVYRAAALIPHGETRSYSWVSCRIRRPAASRAVGQALKRNPLPILIPCHRFTAVGSLGGFMGGAVPNEPELLLKKKLLNLEETYLNPPFAFLAPMLAAAGA